MKWLIGNPYAMGAVAVLVVALAGSSVALYYRSEAATERAENAAQEAERKQAQLDELGDRLYRTNQTLSSRETALRSLRTKYETDARTLRGAPDPTGCADRAVPAPIIRLLMAPGPNGDSHG